MTPDDIVDAYRESQGADAPVVDDDAHYTHGADEHHYADGSPRPEARDWFEAQRAAVLARLDDDASGAHGSDVGGGAKQPGSVSGVPLRGMTQTLDDQSVPAAAESLPDSRHLAASQLCLDCDRPATCGRWCASHFQQVKL